MSFKHIQHFLVTLLTDCDIIYWMLWKVDGHEKDKIDGMNKEIEEEEGFGFHYSPQ